MPPKKKKPASTSLLQPVVLLVAPRRKLELSTPCDIHKENNGKRPGVHDLPGWNPDRPNKLPTPPKERDAQAAAAHQAKAEKETAEKKGWEASLSAVAHLQNEMHEKDEAMAAKAMEVDDKHPVGKVRGKNDKLRCTHVTDMHAHVTLELKRKEALTRVEPADTL